MTKHIATKKVIFDPIAINEAVNAAMDAGLLCAACTTKIQKKKMMKQSDFCTSCEQVVTAQLRLVGHRRLQKILALRGPVAGFCDGR